MKKYYFSELGYSIFIFFLDEGAECTPKVMPCSNILEAFYGISMPIVRRKNEVPVLPMIPLLKGSTRDIGKVLFNSKVLVLFQFALFSSNSLVYRNISLTWNS